MVMLIYLVAVVTIRPEFVSALIILMAPTVSSAIMATTAIHSMLLLLVTHYCSNLVV